MTQQTSKPRLGSLSKAQINHIARHYANELQVPEEENQIRFHIWAIDLHVKDGGNKNDAAMNDHWKALERLGITPDYLFKKSAAKKAAKQEKKEIKLDRKRSKVAIKNARAANIQSKADARVKLAEQGINMGSDVGNVLSKVADTVETVASGQRSPDYSQTSTPVSSTLQQTGGGNVADTGNQDAGDTGGNDGGDNSGNNGGDNDATPEKNKSKVVIIIGLAAVLLIAIFFIAKKK